jgi:flagellar biosynthesis protein FliR
MHVELTISTVTLYAFLLALARVSGLVVFVPIPGFSAGPDSTRAGLALALTLALFPAWPVFAVKNPAPLEVGRLAAHIALETLFGVTVGLLVAFLLEGVQLAAQTLGLQAGYSYASTVDPTTEADTTTLQLMAQLLGGMLFLALGFDRQVLEALARSIQSPAARAWQDGPAIQAVLALGAGIFTTGIQLAMPVLALLILIDIAFGVLGRLHAQLQLLSLSFSIKMLLALAFLASVLTVYPDIFGRSGALTFAVLDRVLIR